MARIKHKDTGVIYEIARDDVDWDAVGADERDMGSEVHYEAVVEHPDLGILTWSLWEYPEGFQNHKQTEVHEHQIVEDFDYRLEHEPDIWADYDLPEDPFTVFMDSYHSTGNLLANHGGDQGDDIVNRMIFSQQIAALEAYLSDTLIKAVLSHNDAKRRLMTTDTELSKKRFSLTDFTDRPDLVNHTVHEHLLSIRYHNLAKVSILYRATLNVTLLDLVSDSQLLFKAIQFRHDCVHRNGRDKSGNRLAIFTKQYVQQIADLIRHFVEKTETALRAQLPF
jgi:hypothetical protein